MFKSISCYINCACFTLTFTKFSLTFSNSKNKREIILIYFDRFNISMIILCLMCSTLGIQAVKLHSISSLK